MNKVQAVLKEAKDDYKIKDVRPYDPEFVEKILKAKQEARAGKTFKININELKKRCL